MSPKPPVLADLTWSHDLQFSATINNTSMVIDSAGLAGPSPMEALAGALAGCMSVDLVYILKRGRHQIRGLKTHFTGDRAADDPHRFTRVALQFTVDGEVPDEAVDRALALSRERYCSVWHSMRQDIDLHVKWERERRS